MPLFDAIEADVTAFLVSQGSAFDQLIKSLLERVASVESRVQLLRADVTANLQTVRQQLLSVSASAAGAQLSLPAVAVDSEALAEAARATERARAEAAADRRAADERAMALARQLNLVLELVFCPPPAAGSAVADVRRKQAALATVADVLQDNDRILDEIGGSPRQESAGSDAEALGEPLSDRDCASDADASVSDSRNAERAMQVETAATDEKEEEEEGEEPPELTPIREERERASETETEATETEATETAIPGRSSGEDAADTLEPSAVDELEPELELVQEQKQEQEQGPTARLDADEAAETTVRLEKRRRPRPRKGSAADERRKSVYHAYQELEGAAAARERELRRRDEALLDAMRAMLAQAIGAAGRSADDSQELRALIGDLAAGGERANSEASARADELVRRLDQQRADTEAALAAHGQRATELRQRLEREADGARAQLEAQRRLADERAAALEQQLQDAAAQLVVLLENRTQAVADRLVALEAALEAALAAPAGVSRVELDELLALAQWTATSNCVFGATPAALARFKGELDAAREVRGGRAARNEDADADANMLDEELGLLAQTVDEALEVARADASGDGDADAVEDGDGNGDGEAVAPYLPLSVDGLRVMKELRVRLGKASALARRGRGTDAGDGGDGDDRGGGDLAFLTAALQRMELGTASLLEASDAQFSRQQRSLQSCQVAVVRLEQQLQRQAQGEAALRARLALCPSQEETQRALLALQDKVAETASDAESHTAARLGELRIGLGELRASLADLPGAELLHRLALDVRGKADRTEMDQLRRLLAAQAASPEREPPGAAPALARAPLRCLSCDQPLWSAPASPSARQSGAGAGRRPPGPCAHCGPAELSEDENGDRETRRWPAETDDAAGALADDLFAVAAAARQRRLRERQSERQRERERERQWQTRGEAPARAATAGARRAFVNLDDGRNRIPLRRPALADHIVYGPAIAPHALRKASAAGSARAASGGERRAPGGHVIARVSTSSALVRPFAELVRSPQPAGTGRRSARGSDS